MEFVSGVKGTNESSFVSAEEGRTSNEWVLTDPFGAEDAGGAKPTSSLSESSDMLTGT